MKKRHQLWLAVLLLLGLAGCARPPQIKSVFSATPPASATNAPPSQTPLPPSATASQPPPSATPSPAPTQTATPSLTPTVSPTPPLAGLFGYTVCRHGPGTAFTVHTYFEQDGTAWVRGRLADNSWYLIELPASGETCWIFNQVLAFEPGAAEVPALTPPPLPTPAPAPTQTDEEKQLGVKYFLIVPDNGGPFACGDGLAYFYTSKKGKTAEDDITIALNALFALKTEYVGQYYNPVYQSTLKVKNVMIENGHATIWLAGTFVKPKSECQAQRIHAQVWETARQFREVTQRPVIWVNNVLLGDLLEHIQD